MSYRARLWALYGIVFALVFWWAVVYFGGEGQIIDQQLAAFVLYLVVLAVVVGLGALVGLALVGYFTWRGYWSG